MDCFPGYHKQVKTSISSLKVSISVPYPSLENALGECSNLIGWRRFCLPTRAPWIFNQSDNSTTKIFSSVDFILLSFLPSDMELCQRKGRGSTFQNKIHSLHKILFICVLLPRTGKATHRSHMISVNLHLHLLLLYLRELSKLIPQVSLSLDYPLLISSAAS